MKSTRKLSKKDVKEMKKNLKDFGKLDKMTKEYTKNLKALTKISEKVLKRKKISIEEGIEIVDLMCELEEISKKIKKGSKVDF